MGPRLGYILEDGSKLGPSLGFNDMLGAMEGIKLGAILIDGCDDDKSDGSNDSLGSMDG